MPVSRLIFAPSNTNTQVDYKQLQGLLTDIQFINSEPYKENHFLPGDNFLSQITFLGCSPNINLIPTEGESHCYISFLDQSEQANCLGYTSNCNPKCPSCTKRIADWKVNNWNKAGLHCTCDKCGTQSLYAELIWKNECIYGTSGFVINHIYPHEAVPTEQLLDHLKSVTGNEWAYAYANNDEAI